MSNCQISNTSIHFLYLLSYFWVTGVCWSLSQLSRGKRRGRPWIGRQPSAGQIVYSWLCHPDNKWVTQPVATIHSNACPWEKPWNILMTQGPKAHGHMYVQSRTQGCSQTHSNVFNISACPAGIYSAVTVEGDCEAPKASKRNLLYSESVFICTPAGCCLTVTLAFMHSCRVQLKRRRSTGNSFHLCDMIRVLMLSTEYALWQACHSAGGLNMIHLLISIDFYWYLLFCWNIYDSLLAFDHCLSFIMEFTVLQMKKRHIENS